MTNGYENASSSDSNHRQQQQQPQFHYITLTQESVNVKGFRAATTDK